jgi:hypothetical protein
MNTLNELIAELTERVKTLDLESYSSLIDRSISDHEYHKNMGRIAELNHILKLLKNITPCHTFY